MFVYLLSFVPPARLMAANPTLCEQSVRILLERGLVQVEGGTAALPSPPCFTSATENKM